jgi:hypothetical protein
VCSSDLGVRRYERFDDDSEDTEYWTKGDDGKWVKRSWEEREEDRDVPPHITETPFYHLSAEDAGYCHQYGKSGMCDDCEYYEEGQCWLSSPQQMAIGK